MLCQIRNMIKRKYSRNTKCSLLKNNICGIHGLHKVSYSYQITEWQQLRDSTPLPGFSFFSINFCMKSSPYQSVVVKKYHWKEIRHPNVNRVSATSKLFISNSFNPFQLLTVSPPKSSQLVKKSLEKPSDMKAMP